MAIKKYNVEVTRVTSLIIEIDDEIINEEFAKEYEKCFYKLDRSGHVGDIAYYVARYPDDTFIEGYGDITKPENGIRVKLEWEDTECQVEEVC